MARLGILSDIHGNLFALDKVLEDLSGQNIDKLIMLGDLIDYGMQSNEVVERVRDLDSDSMIIRIWGNHEFAILRDYYEHFSSQRGVDSAKYTRSVLSEENAEYLNREWNPEGVQECTIDGLRFLAVHASMDDPYWKAIAPGNLRGKYSEYDVVLSGHSHYSFCFTEFYKADRPEMRNKKAVRFINPGSVGQPRNQIPHAQYAVMDTATMQVDLRCVPYDVEAAMLLYHGQVDDFYRARLENGI